MATAGPAAAEAARRLAAGRGQAPEDGGGGVYKGKKSKRKVKPGGPVTDPGAKPLEKPQQKKKQKKKKRKPKAEEAAADLGFEIVKAPTAKGHKRKRDG